MSENLHRGRTPSRDAVGDKLRVESLKVEAGDKIDLDQVLMAADGENLAVVALN